MSVIFGNNLLQGTKKNMNDPFAAYRSEGSTHGQNLDFKNEKGTWK